MVKRTACFSLFLAVMVFSLTGVAQERKVQEGAAAGPKGPVPKALTGFGETPDRTRSVSSPAPTTPHPVEAAPVAPKAVAGRSASAEKERATSLEPIHKRVPSYWLAPTLRGGFGLFQTQNALSGEPWTFGIALHGEYFRYGSFLIAGRNETNTRVAGGVRLDLVLPYHIQLFATLLSSSNVNERDHKGPSFEPTTQMALGDFLFGAKYGRKLTPYLSLGASVFSRLYSGVGQVGPDMSATAVGGLVLLTLDGRTLLNSMSIPVLLHLNVGYVYDNSMSLMGDAPHQVDHPDTLQPLFQFLVRQFALGVSRSRVEFSVGMEAPLKVGRGVLAPMVEYGLKYFTSSADKALLSWEEQDRIVISGETAADHPLAHNMIVGVRYHLNKQFSFDFGVDIAVGYPGFAVAPSLPVYNLFAGVNYRAVPKSLPCKQKTIIKTKSVVKYVEKPVKREVMGFITGKVEDEQGNPIAGAIVSFPGTGKTDQASDELGGFTSYKLKPGDYTLLVNKKGFKVQEIKVKLTSDRPVSVTIKLKRKAVKKCSITLQVVDTKNKGIPAEVILRGKSMDGSQVDLEEALDASGKKEFKIKPGAYEVILKSKKHLSRQRALTLPKCETTNLKVTMRRKPRKSAVSLNKRRKRITIKRKVLFRYNSATLRKKSYSLLDQIASLLIEHPEVLQVRIEGHTDNRGSRAYNLKLSQRRAESVRAYLIAQGVDGSRLVAKGYGRSRPRYANISRRLRKKNRRVEFKILKQK